MNLKKGICCLFILTFVMCFTIYQIRDGEKEEVRSQYEQDKSHKIIALEEKISELQNQITSISKSSSEIAKDSEQKISKLQSSSEIAKDSSRGKIPPIAEVATGVIDGVETGVNKRLSVPRAGQEMNPVISKHIEDLKIKQNLNIDPRQAPAIAFAKLEPRETNLTFEEKKLMKLCIRNGPRDRSHNGSKFFGPVQVIRRNHHTYLGEDKLMIEVGGNWGWDAGNFSKIYNPRFLILEPLPEYVGILRKKFENNPQVSVYNLGLGAKNESLMVTVEGNNACATSKFSGKKGSVPIYVINAVDFFASVGIGSFEVDLLTLNCEGCEYEALETLLTSNIIKSFRNIQWATHSTLKMKDPIGRYCCIEQLLLRTHRPTYQYRFIWESWRRRDIK